MRIVVGGIVATLVALLVLGACGDDGGATGSGDRLEGRTFLSEELSDQGVVRSLVDGTTIRLEFADGEVRAHAGCNHLFGTIESIAEGRLQIGPMGGTEMGCDRERHDQDRWLAELLTSSPTWSLDGDRLVITSGDTRLVLLDRRVADPDRPLESTPWVVDTILQGDAAMSVPTDAQAELTFRDGRVAGSTGCNELSGTYRLDGAILHLSTLVQTDVACEPDVMVLEDAVLALSGESLEFEIVAGRLTLVASDGRGLGLHAAE